ncbi:MAG TPA: glycosyl hydrolase family 17 protein [Bacteroidales bacterium]
MKILSLNMGLLKYFGIILLLSVVVFSCEPGINKNKEVKKKTEQLTNPIQQDKNDLLFGISKAVCYSGFRSGQHPDRGEGAINPSYEEILEDLTILSKEADFHLIRIYDSGENSELVLKVIRENNIDIKVMLGIWLRAELSNHESCEWLTEPIPDSKLKENKKLNLAEIEKGIQLANEYSNIVVAVNVGNEALVDWNDHKVDTDTIISYVKKVKNAIAQPVTVAENYEWWAANGKNLAAECDFIALHIYPVWEGKDIGEAMAYSIENIQKVRDSIPESIIVISEAGWASEASEFGERASEEKQLQYYNEFRAWSEEMNITTFFFEAFDEDWKGDPDNPLGAEKHWGLYTVDRKPKKVMQKFYQKQD